MITLYTTPILKKGKPVASHLKGSSKLREEAKQIWYVEYFYDGKQIRVKKGLNRIDDPEDKLIKAEALVELLKEQLVNGFNPNDPDAYADNIKKQNISLDEAIALFKEYHQKHNSRSKTISTYMSKLNALSAHFPGVSLKDITTKDLENFVQVKINDGTWARGSVGSAKRIFSAFFNVMILEKYASNNPKEAFNKKINSKKRVDTKHYPYSETDLKRVFAYLDANDKFTAFFCRTVYYTCIRPGELRGLQIKHVDIEKRQITIPASVKKNTVNDEDDTLTIDKNFTNLLKTFSLEQYPADFYLTGSTVDIMGVGQIGINTAYQKLMTALKRIDEQDVKENPSIKDTDRIINKGYDLYSFKHTSNIRKYLNNWSLAEIMKANRHGSISMTERYLKNLGIFIDISDLEVPVI